ncbi:MAG: hypothetical protein SPF89_05895 [Sphaerochaetaceae bacterium]|nr:hypothetical protein [Spirochaetales bacterium]MDY5499621.1 hypothetical protein [Sphaerochaetaceae bacterium]
MRMLVLLLPEELRLQVRRYRHSLYRHSGDPSAFWGPDAVLLGKTKLSHIPQGIPYPPQAARLQEPTTSSQGLVIPVSGLECLASFFRCEEEPSIFLARNATNADGAPKGIIDDYRVGLADIEQAEGLVTWSVLESVHLWKGKDR